MALQIAIGTALILLSLLFVLLAFWSLQAILSRPRDWLAQEPHSPKMLLVLVVTAFWVLGTVTMGVWLWALVLLWLDVFQTLEASVYFALVAFTTLGFGDVLLPQAWRLLSGMAAANGLLLMGLLTAMLVEVLRDLRVAQQDWLRSRDTS